MSIQMPFGGVLLIHRLVRICTSGLGYHRHREIHSSTKLSKQTKHQRTFSVGQTHCNDSEKANADLPSLNPDMAARRGSVPSRRRQPLSPLERISRLLPKETLSPEVMELREQNQEESEDDTNVQKGDTTVDFSVTPCHSTQLESGHPETLKGGSTIPEGEVSHVHGSLGTPAEANGLESLMNGAFPHPDEHTLTTLPGDSLLKFGELLISEYRKKWQVEYRKMFQLQEGGRLHSSWGTIGHNDIVSQPSGRFLKTTLGIPILIRRASLEDYVLYMKRGPAITYPKDANTMLMMMDVTEGHCVLETGTGSGAMSLFLSRAVGSKGRVLSIEVREDHHVKAVRNYNRWRASWDLRQEQKWPNNVQFHKGDLCKDSSLLSGWGFHSVALDLINPHLVLPTVIPHLHPGAVCAVYLANITQVVDLMEGIRCSGLPLLCERIIEVPIRDWLVTPARQKDGEYCARKAPITDKDKIEENDESDELHTKKHPPFGSVPYVARPHPEQMSHTAFLTRLRKYA